MVQFILELGWVWWAAIGAANLSLGILKRLTGWDIGPGAFASLTGALLVAAAITAGSRERDGRLTAEDQLVDARQEISQRDKQDLVRVQESLDKLMRGELEVEDTDGNEGVAEAGIRKVIKPDTAISIMMRYRPLAIPTSNTAARGKKYLFDVFAGAPNRNRLSLYFQRINDVNYLVLRLFDASGDEYTVSRDVRDWKVGDQVFVAGQCSGKSGILELYIKGVGRTVRLESPNIEEFGPELFFGRDYTNRNE